MSKKMINLADKPSFLEQEQHFSQGLRVLVIDDNAVCLKSLACDLQKCGYQVTMTTEAVKALAMLRKNKDAYQIVITDAKTSDMDGFKLLEIIGLEMDIPVIMTSENSDVKIIEKGIKHGARDYLVKPVRIEILRNIWQHVIKKTIYDPRPAEKIVADRRSTRDIVLHEGNQRREDREATQPHNEEPLVCRKTRVTWTPELHAKFVAAVQQLREGAAVPKKILELMKDPHLTREQVASHLQKYRASLKQKKRTRQQSKDRLDASRTTHASREPKNESFRSQSPLLLPPNHNPDLFLQQQNPVLPSEDVNQVLQTMTIPALTPASILTIDPHCQSDFNAIEYQPIQYQINGITRPLNQIVPYPCASGALINQVDTSNLMSGDYTGQITLFSQPDSITGLLLPSSLPGNHEPRNLATFSGKGGTDFKGEARATGPLVDMRGQVDGSTDNELIDYTQFFLNNSDREIQGAHQNGSSPDDDLGAFLSQVSEDDYNLTTIIGTEEV